MFCFFYARLCPWLVGVFIRSRLGFGHNWMQFYTFPIDTLKCTNLIIENEFKDIDVDACTIVSCCVFFFFFQIYRLLFETSRFGSSIGLNTFVPHIAKANNIWPCCKNLFSPSPGRKRLYVWYWRYVVIISIGLKGLIY